MKKIVIIFSISCIIFLFFITCNKDKEIQNVKTIEGVVSVTYPEGLLVSGIGGNIELEKISDNTTLEIFNETAGLFRVSNILPYQIKISCDAQPYDNFIEVSLNIPDDFIANVPQNYGIELFAQVYQNGGEEVLDNFEILESSYDPSTKVLSAKLPGLIFTNMRTNGRYEAILTAAATPGISNVQTKKTSYQVNDGGCLAAGIICPVGNCEVTSPYTQLNRNIPELNHNRPHLGTDFRAQVGTPVVVVNDGVIERVKVNPGGYGLYIIVRHGLAATLYAHLSESSFPIGSSGQSVLKGQQIGLSGGMPGNVYSGSSTGPHLHFEYVPNGEIIQSKNRIDPVPCINNYSSESSISIGDNGTLADDAFAAYIDGLFIGQTEIGATNNMFISNLLPGIKELKIECLIAPDDAGTLEIMLNDGITFIDGSSEYSDVLTQGQIITKSIIIPNTRSLRNKHKSVSKPNKYVEK